MSADPKELYSLLIPLRAERLLVPRMCVAEVIAFADAARSRDDVATSAALASNGRAAFGGGVAAVTAAAGASPASGRTETA